MLVKKLSRVLLSVLACSLWAESGPLFPALPNPPAAFARNANSKQSALPAPRLKQWETPKKKELGLYSGDNALLAFVTDKPFMALRLGKSYGLFYFDGGSIWKYVADPKTGKNARYVIDEKNQSFNYEHKATLPDGSEAIYSQGARVTPSGLIAAHWGFMNSTKATSNVSGPLTTSLKYADIAGFTLRVNGKDTKLPPDNYVMKTRRKDLITPWTPVSDITLLTPDGRDFLGIMLPDSNRCSIKLTRAADKLRPERLQLRVMTKDGNVKLNLDIRSGEASTEAANADAFHGVSFWKSNRFVAPDYRKSANLIQNPSFEGDLHYYNFGYSWKAYHPRENAVFSVSETESKSGDKSLMFKVAKGDSWAGYIRTFAMPVKTDKTYTMSFFAKAEQDGMILRLRGFTPRGFTKFNGKDLSEFGNKRDHSQCVRLTREWKRYVMSFKTPANAFSFGLAPDYIGKGQVGTAYVDCLQLEDGDHVTDYIEKPICAFLESSNPDNFFNVDDNIDAKLRIVTKPEQSGVVTCSLKNFFGENVWNGTFDYKANSNGIAMIPLALNSAVKLGVYVLRVDFKSNAGFEDSDFFRLTRMKFVNGSTSLADFFTTLYSPVASSRGEDAVKRLAAVGYGCLEAREENYEAKYVHDTAGSPIDVHNLCLKYGVKDDSGMMCNLIQRVLYKDDKSKRFAALSDNNGRYWTFVRDLKTVTPEFEKAVEDLACETAKARPWIINWDFRREMEGMRLMMAHKDKEVAKLIVAAQRGLKRGNPNAKLRLCDTSHLDRLDITERYIDACEDVDSTFKADALSSNHYTFRPEKSDTDENLKNFLRLADKKGYADANVYLLEGMYYGGSLPHGVFATEWGTNRDGFRTGFPSYDMSVAEKLYAAYCARQWIIGMKYRDRVKRMNNWGHKSMDYYLTPEAYEKVPNTLCDLFGDATFKDDIRFSPGARCYVFEDPKKRPVAALWTCLDDVDLGKRQGHLFNFKFGDMKPEAFDLMGNQRSYQTNADGVSVLPVNAYPIFLRGDAGGLNKLVTALRGGWTDENLGVSEVKLNARLKDISTLELTFENQIGREVSATLNARIGSELVTRSINLKANASETILLPLKNAISDTHLTPIDIPIALTSGGKTVDIPIAFSAFAVTRARTPINIDGDAKQWKDIPTIDITNKKLSDPFKCKLTKSKREGYPGDFDVKLRMAWDSENLYLNVSVKDDNFTCNQSLIDGEANRNPRWRNDCLQVYMDTLGDAPRVKGAHVKGYDENDLNYDFFPNQDGSVDIYRGRMPDIQIQGGVACAFHANTWVEKGLIHAKTKFFPDGYEYIIAIPARNLTPFVLKNGSLAGFSLTVTDNDGDKFRKTLRVMTPPGTESFRKPQLYPVMILTE